MQAQSFDASSGVATLALPGHKALNILGRAGMAQATASIHALAQDPRVRVLVVQGPQPGCFVGGADIHEMCALNGDSARAFITQLRDLCESLRRFPAPVIARLQGWCLGAGLELAMACDLRVAGFSARLGMPEVKVGIPSVIHAALLPRLVGTARAQWLLLTGEPIAATQALAWGLVHELVDDEQLDAAVATRAAGLAALGPHVLRQQKRLLREWGCPGVDAAIAASIDEFAAAFATGEPQRYMGEFLARRAAFRG